MEWAVSITHAWPLNEQEAEKLLDRLAPYSAILECRGDGTTATLSIEAEDIASAWVEATGLLNPSRHNGPPRDLQPRGIDTWLGTAIAVRIQTAAEVDRELEQVQIPPLAGVTDFAEILGLSRQRAWDITQKPGFPSPVAELKSGPLWLRIQLETWAKTHERKPGRPRMASDGPHSPGEVARQRVAMKRAR